jgi:hypothetical protein
MQPRLSKVYCMQYQVFQRVSSCLECYVLCVGARAQCEQDACGWAERLIMT